MPGATQRARPWERNGRATMNQLELATGWRCGLPAALRDAATTLAARSLPGRWQRWRQAKENDEEARRQEPSKRHERREQPDARRELDERQPWTRRMIEHGTVEERFQRTPTWRAKCQMWGSGKTLKVRTLGCARRFPPTDSRPQPRRDL